MARSFWAVPAPEDAQPLAEQIARLSAAAGTALFPPHITLKKLDPSLEAFTVELFEVQDSDDRFRCVTLAARPAGPLGEVDAPHLSLLYAELDAEARERMRQLVDLPLPRSVLIDSVQLVDTSDDDYTKWSVVETWRLTSARRPPGPR